MARAWPHANVAAARLQLNDEVGSRISRIRTLGEDMSYQFIYITVGSKDEALRIGQALLKDRVVACVNLFDQVHSMYWWNGSIQQDEEVVLIAKSKAEHWESLKERVRELHSYSCPCVVSLPLQQGNEPFLAWIDEQVKSISAPLKGPNASDNKAV